MGSYTKYDHNLLIWLPIITKIKIGKIQFFYKEPFYEKNQKVRFGYLIEIKYIPRGEKLTENILNKKRAEAKKQLLKYAQDDVISKKSHTKLKLIYQIWHGWELVEMEEI